jgi:hypothetical protein
MIIILGMDRPATYLRLPCEPTIQAANGTYCMAEVDMPHCDGPSDSSTPYVNVEIGNFSFSMRIERCYAPGGQALAGTCTPADGASSAFGIRGLQGPDEWLWWFSPDAGAAVRWDRAYTVQVMYRVD